jgi:hypothetical protein
VWVPDASVNKHVRCLEGNNSKEEGTLVAGHGRGLEYGQCLEVCQVPSMTPPLLHCFNYPSPDASLPSVEASTEDDGLPPFENGSPLRADGVGSNTIFLMEEATEFLSVEENGWAAQTLAAGDLVREPDPSPCPCLAAQPAQSPCPCLAAQPVPLASCAFPSSNNQVSQGRGQVQQTAVSALVSPALASQAVVSPVSYPSAAVRPAAAASPASTAPPGNMVYSSGTVLTPAQQSFLSQVTKKIGAVLPVPRVNKRRPKGPATGIIPRRSRRLADLSAERRHLGSTRSKKGS